MVFVVSDCGDDGPIGSSRGTVTADDLRGLMVVGFWLVFNSVVTKSKHLLTFLVAMVFTVNDCGGGAVGGSRGPVAIDGLRELIAGGFLCVLSVATKSEPLLVLLENGVFVVNDCGDGAVGGSRVTLTADDLGTSAIGDSCTIFLRLLSPGSK